MKEINIICPACKADHKLYMKSDSVALLLHCPSCRTVLLYYNNHTMKVEKQEIFDIAKAKKIKNVRELMDLISKKKPKLKAPSVSQFKPKKVRSSGKKKQTVQSERPSRDEPIGKEDVINLLIDINTSESVSDFLDKLK